MCLVIFILESFVVPFLCFDPAFYMKTIVSSLDSISTGWEGVFGTGSWALSVRESRNTFEALLREVCSRTVIIAINILVYGRGGATE